VAITKGFLCTKKMFKNKSAMKLWILYLFFPSWRFANSLRFWKNNQNPQFFGFEKLKKIRINEYYQNQITQPNYRFFTSYSFMKIPNSWRFSKTTRTHNSLVLKHWKKIRINKYYQNQFTHPTLLILYFLFFHENP